MPRLTATFCIYLPPEMALEIKTACRNEHRTRSELVREALRSYLRDAEFRAYQAKVARMPEAMPAIGLVRRGRRRKPR